MSSIDAAADGVLDEIAERTGVAYDPETGTAAFADVPTDTEQYVALLAYLVEEGYVDDADLPIAAARAQTRYLVNDTPSHEDREMIRPREVADGVYLETNHDSASKGRYAARFIEEYVLGE